jgi:hypothetical protein
MSINEENLFDMELFDGIDSGGGGCLTNILIAAGILLLIGKLFS